MAHIVAKLTSRPALATPTSGVNRTIKCERRPICANRASANATESVRNLGVRIISERDSLGVGFATAGVAESLSGARPRLAGVGLKYLAESSATALTVTMATDRAAIWKPKRSIRNNQRGTNKTPPTLAPLNARPIAFGRSRSNHLATMELRAAPLVVAQPAALGIAATKSCHGCQAL